MCCKSCECYVEGFEGCMHDDDYEAWAIAEEVRLYGHELSEDGA